MLYSAYVFAFGHIYLYPLPWQEALARFYLFSTLALSTSRFSNHVCYHRGEPLAWLFLVFVGTKLDLGRVQNNHTVTAAALLAPAALPPVLADTATATLLADAAPPPVLANAAAAALLALVALPPVLADATAAALLADAAPPPVLALLPFHCVFYSRFERALTFVLRTGGVPRRDPRRAHVR